MEGPKEVAQPVRVKACKRPSVKQTKEERAELHRKKMEAKGHRVSRELKRNMVEHFNRNVRTRGVEANLSRHHPKSGKHPKEAHVT